MRVFTPSPHVLVFAGLSEAAAAQALTTPGTGQILGAAGFLVALIMAFFAYRRDRRDRKAEQARQLEQHDENRDAVRSLVASQEKLWAFLLGVEGVGGLQSEMRRSQKFRHKARGQLGAVFGVLHEQNNQLEKVSEHLKLEYDHSPVEQRRRRADAEGDEDE